MNVRLIVTLFVYEVLIAVSQVLKLERSLQSDFTF